MMYTVIIRHSYRLVYLNRQTESEAQAIASKVVKTGRFNGFKASLDRVVKRSKLAEKIS